MFESALPAFQTYLLPALPFRRRHSSTTSTGSTSTSASTAPPQPSYLTGAHSHISCARCHADLAATTQIVSKGFTGRHGRAYLVAPARGAAGLPNTRTHRAAPRHLVTGLHTVSDVSCAACGSVLGWKYVGADEAAQRYKVGKVILESRRTVVGSCWEGGAAAAADDEEEDDDEVRFDSQDEDECDELFAGVWSAGGARRRRAKKRAGAGAA